MFRNLSKFSKRIRFKKLLDTVIIQNVTVRRRIMSSPHPTIEIPNTTVSEFLFQSFDKYPNETAVECSLTGKKYTFDQIRTKSRNFNQNLRKKLKLNKGDVVALILTNVPDFPICFLGAIEAGLVVTPINPVYTPAEISYQLNETSAKAIITLGSTYSTAKEAAKLSKQSIPIFTVKMKQSEELPKGAIDLNEFTETGSQVENVFGLDGNDTILLPFSSGTTGLPKGVELSHYNIIANVCQVSCDTVVHLPPRTASHVNVVPAILPWFHIYGTTINLLQQLYCFSKLISMPKFTPDGFIKLLSEHTPNILYLVPPLVSFLSVHPSVKPKMLDRLTVLTSGAAPLGKSDEDKFIKKLGRHVDILQGYGLTETSPAISISTLKSIKQFGHTGSSGLILPNTSIKIVSTTNPSIKLLERNEKGEILIKGPQVMKKYYNRPKETEQSFLDGWFRSGDFGHFDDNGLLYVTDRLKELIKVRGFQVAPAELEEVLRAHNDVSDAGVIGVCDNLSGEVPLAYIVPKLNSKINVKDLHEHMSKNVASYKQLKGGIIFVDSLPKTASGKLLRKELKLQHQNSQRK